ncbi:hypothetical protein UlMin_033070 [Ulmus minor]
MVPKKDKAAPPSSKPMTSGDYLCSNLQKWSKGKQNEKVNNMVLFDQATYDKLLTEAPKFKLVTPSILSDRLRVRWNGFPSYNATNKIVNNCVVNIKFLMHEKGYSLFSYHA